MLSSDTYSTIIGIQRIFDIAPVWAADLQNDGKDIGKVDLSIKVFSVIDAEDNGYDPNDATAYLLKLKYETAEWNKVKLGVGMYTNGDLFKLTDFDTERVARGLFVTDDGSEKSQLGELYLDYKPGQYHLYGGRMIYKTPLTTIKYNTIADELDIVLIWQAQKDLMFKLFHANRTSEYDGSNGKDLTQAHTRLIAVYKF